MLRSLILPGNSCGEHGWRVASRDPGVSSRATRLIWNDESSSLAILDNQSGAATPTFIVTFDEIARFELSFAAREVAIVRLDDEVSENTIEHLLLDQIWPRILAHQGQLVIHAAGVATPDGAILFVGRSGRGKSTLAASLHQCGFSLLGDDAFVISSDEGVAHCSAVYRSLRLFPDSIETVFGADIAHSSVAFYSDKRNVVLGPAQDETGGQHRVRAIFFLGEEDAAKVCESRTLPPSNACMLLVEHSFWLDPADIEMTARKFRNASALANEVPMFKLDYPRDYATLGEVHAVLHSALGEVADDGFDEGSRS